MKFDPRAEERSYVGPPKSFFLFLKVVGVLALCALCYMAGTYRLKPSSFRAANRQATAAKEAAVKAAYLGKPLTIDDLPLDKRMQVSPSCVDMSEGSSDY